ncbi:hypothetical protein HMPREF0650_0152 [Hoylesella buccalis ATCC 35310]|uniref:Uncharacterized protein n=1 Tax=Hoylesella buccalis ATCC 35310 TaxID=679190 RepID=D1W2P8_9BACT|nr:hypothetical protein HMPREF0650_0152 [Hoylesella buccalis ATCC 35310]
MRLGISGWFAQLSKSGSGHSPLPVWEIFVLLNNSWSK